jgi:hypothetical protein
LAPSDFHLFGPLKATLVANFSLVTKSLKRRCGSDWDNSEKTSVLRASTHWQSDGTIVSMLLEDMSRNNFFSRQEYHMFCVSYAFVTYLLTLPRINQKEAQVGTLCYTRKRKKQGLELP